MENKKEPQVCFFLPQCLIKCVGCLQALQYIFRLLDIEGKGYLSTFSLKFFFKASFRVLSFLYLCEYWKICVLEQAIQERLKSEGHSPVIFEDVKVIH